MEGKKRYKIILFFTIIIYITISFSFPTILSDGTVDVSFNPEFSQTPNQPTNPVPADGATDQPTTVTLQVYVTDPDGDNLHVYFYNAADDSQIGSVDIVANGTNASVVWSGLSSGTTYSWYAIANDTQTHNISDTWSFTTVESSTPAPPPPSPPPVINQPPVANITGEKEGYINQNLTFFANKSYDPDENYPLKYYWDYDNDGLWDTPGMKESIYIHQFQTTGYHTIRLKVKDSLGATNITTYTIKINEIPPEKQFPKPKINGRYEGVVNQKINFSSEGSLDPDGNITRYTWYLDIENNVISNEKNPTHFYDKTGYYIIILKVTDNDNLSNTVWTTVTVYSDSSEVKNDTNDDIIDDKKEKPEYFLIPLLIISIIIVTIIISYIVFKRKELNDVIKKLEKKSKTYTEEEIKKPEITMLLPNNKKIEKTKKSKNNSKKTDKQPKKVKKTTRKKTTKTTTKQKKIKNNAKKLNKNKTNKK